MSAKDAHKPIRVIKYKNRGVQSVTHYDDRADAIAAIALGVRKTKAMHPRVLGVVFKLEERTSQGHWKVTYSEKCG